LFARITLPSLSQTVQSPILVTVPVHLRHLSSVEQLIVIQNKRADEEYRVEMKSSMVTAKDLK